jgi:hypothetical protein
VFAASLSTTASANADSLTLSVSNQAPGPDQQITVSATTVIDTAVGDGTGEVTTVYADTSRTCAQNDSDELGRNAASSVLYADHSSPGTFTNRASLTLPNPGQYVLCGYVGAADGTSTDAVASTPVTVVRPAGSLAIALSESRIVGDGTIKVHLTGALGPSTAPVRLNVYLDPGACDAATDFATIGSPWHSFAIDSAGRFSMAAAFTTSGQFESNYGRWNACAYLGRPVDLYGNGELLARAQAAISYVQPPQTGRPQRPRPSSHPPSPAQLQDRRVEAAVRREVGGFLNTPPGNQSASCHALRSGYYKCSFMGFDQLTSEYRGQAHATVYPGGTDVVIDYIHCYIGNGPGGGCKYA